MLKTSPHVYKTVASNQNILISITLLNEHNTFIQDLCIAWEKQKAIKQ